MKNSTLLFICLLFFPAGACLQGTSQTVTPKKEDALRVAFYNVENLFDIYNDSLIDDEEFLPTADKGWNETRYREKLDHIYKTLVGVGEWGLPAIIGFCEVENRAVLFDLVSKTPLVKYDYQIVHEESPDARGIDVGLIFNPKKFRVITHKALPVKFPFAPGTKTRDVLYVKGVVFKTDTVHLFINHWPSRSGGQAASEPRRMFVAEMLRMQVDSINAADADANIIITGDFNDEPGDKSIREGLVAKGSIDSLAGNDLYNFMYPYFLQGEGTEKYKEHWGLLDQMIVSRPLVTRKKGLTVDGSKAYIFRGEWLLEEDKRYLGQMPFRTYAGPRYLGGYSDHLPVYLDLVKVKK